MDAVISNGYLLLRWKERLTSCQSHSKVIFVLPRLLLRLNQDRVGACPFQHEVCTVLTFHELTVHL